MFAFSKNTVTEDVCLPCIKWLAPHRSNDWDVRIIGGREIKLSPICYMFIISYIFAVTDSQNDYLEQSMRWRWLSSGMLRL
jgi:hypothetical protein